MTATITVDVLDRQAVHRLLVEHGFDFATSNELEIRGGRLTGRVVGDIVVCPSTAERQAPGHSGDPHDEIAVLLVHAALHLVGHDHAEADERDRMWRAEQQALAAHWRPLQRDPWAARSAEVVP